MPVDWSIMNNTTEVSNLYVVGLPSTTDAWICITNDPEQKWKIFTYESQNSSRWESLWIEISEDYRLTIEQGSVFKACVLLLKSIINNNMLMLNCHRVI